MVEEGLLGDIGADADLRDPRLMKTLLGEQLAGGLEDPRAQLELAPFAPALQPQGMDMRQFGLNDHDLRQLGYKVGGDPKAQVFEHLAISQTGLCEKHVTFVFRQFNGLIEYLLLPGHIVLNCHCYCPVQPMMVVMR